MCNEGKIVATKNVKINVSICNAFYMFSRDVTTLMSPKCDDIFICGYVGTIDVQVLVSW